MTTAPSQSQTVQSSLLADSGCFNMWHDYLDLGRMLEKLCHRREVEHKDTRYPETEQASPRREDHRQSAESSSASSLSDSSSSSDFCRFCKQNGETPRVYRSHKLKTNDGRVACPILRTYTCPMCEATGDRAHTRRYCPQMRDAARMLPRRRFW
ncbi:nanos homolog 2-like [Echeneis naucrates]|uniref:Nanos homolog 2-like n=1 Tax=Echeneis naucrates TaxID=173247 RepID=A0A665VI72_ECHNA|nr:nanos homolog 2-like [Echeneis naucrates]